MGEERGQLADLEQVILRLLRQRKEGASICPSDAARADAAATWTWSGAAPTGVA